MLLWKTTMLIFTLDFLLFFQDVKMTGNMLANLYNLCALCDSSLLRPVNPLQTRLGSPLDSYYTPLPNSKLGKLESEEEIKSCFTNAVYSCA